MKIKFLLIFVLSFIFANAEKPIVKWANRSGGNSDDLSQSMATDTNGNIYVAGYFLSSSITFGSTTLNNAYQNEPHIFLVKYDSIGNVLWAKSTGIYDSGYGLSVTVDKSGNAYVSGFFKSSQITFGTFSLFNNSGGYYGALFIVKYDASGKEQWAKTSISNTSNSMNSVCTDNLGNVYATGHFQDNSITFESITISNSNSPNQEVFIVKYNSLGNIIWAKSFGGDNNDVGNSVSVDQKGNLFVTGVFASSSILFGSTVLTNNSPGSQDIFIVKYDTNGNLIWAKSAGGNSNDVANSITTDQLGNTFIGGYYKSSSINFGNTTLNNTNSGFSKNFIAKYDTNGNVMWAKSGSNSTQNDDINSLNADKYGNIYTTGYFDSPSITFDTVKLTNKSQYSQDLFVTKYDTSGKVIWAKEFGGTGDDYGKSISADNYGNVYLSGQFTSPTLAFDSKILSNATGSNDIFVAKLFSNSVPDTLIINYCASDSVATVTASDGYASYKWMDYKGISIGTSKILDIKNPADSAVYTCNMTSVSNITEIVYVKIIKYELNVDFTYENNCNSNTVQFTNLSSKTKGTLLYNWNFGNGNTSTETNPQFTFNTSGLHDVFLEVSNPPSSCTKFITHTINTLLPVLIRIDGDSTFCPGYSTTLKGHGADHYLWSTGETTDSIKINTQGQIWIIGYSSTGCISDKIYKTISKEPDWILTVNGNTVICNNDTTHLIATGAKYYLWNTGDTTPSISISSPGTYNVTGINDRGCQQRSQDITVIKDLIPQIDFSISKSTIDSRNNEITCIIPELNDVQYSWEMGDGLFENGSTIKHTYNISTSIPEYKITLTATTKNGCVYTKTKTVDVIPFIPNVFTPNNDGVNDVFMADFDLQIIDRYGLTLYKGNNGWDGTFNGKLADPDTYFYLIHYFDKNHILKTKKGYITLIRKLN